MRMEKIFSLRPLLSFEKQQLNQVNVEASMKSRLSYADIFLFKKFEV